MDKSPAAGQPWAVETKSASAGVQPWAMETNVLLREYSCGQWIRPEVLRREHDPGQRVYNSKCASPEETGTAEKTVPATVGGELGGDGVETAAF